MTSKFFFQDANTEKCLALHFHTNFIFHFRPFFAFRGGYRFLKMNHLIYKWDSSQETIPKLFTKLVEKHPKRVAFYFEDEAWTYQQVS